MAEHSEKITSDSRFEFGKNWQSFLTTLNDSRIEFAVSDLREMLGLNDLSGMSFLDIGSGSGLSSLAARRLGATVYSFDYDPHAVKCTKLLRDRYFSNDNKWSVMEGSVLDDDFIKSLGKVDIVYSWGVLHHTGNMWKAIDNTLGLVTSNGHLFIAIYNNQGVKSKIWLKIKEAYNKGRILKAIVIAIGIPLLFLRGIAVGLIKYRNPLRYFLNYKNVRGMSFYHDYFDWLGGLPYETARPEELFDFIIKNGFILLKMKTTITWGCNQMVFRKVCSTDTREVGQEVQAPPSGDIPCVE